MQSPFQLEVRRGVGATKILSFYKDDGVTIQDVSASTMYMRIYTNDSKRTLVNTYTLTAGVAVNEKVVTFLAADVATPTTYYAELDQGNPATDGAYGFVKVVGK